MLLSPRTAAAGLLTLALAAAPAVAHAAPTYPPGGGDSITVTTTSPEVGATVTVTAKTFEAGSDVDVTTVTEGDAADNALGDSGSLGGGRAATAVVAAAAGTCETGSTCTVVADSDGVATAAVKLTLAGTTNVTFSGVGTDGEALTQTVELEVEGVPGAAAPVDENLANTGAGNVLQAGVIALAMLGVGTVLVLAVRRRRDTFVPA